MSSTGMGCSTMKPLYRCIIRHICICSHPGTRARGWRCVRQRQAACRLWVPPLVWSQTWPLRWPGLCRVTMLQPWLAPSLPCLVTGNAGSNSPRRPSIGPGNTMPIGRPQPLRLCIVSCIPHTRQRKIMAMSAHPIAAAYDSIAAQYDDLVAEDFWMRRVLWAHYTEVFQPGAQVLDVACGTGLDTLFLAAHGIQVTGIDISPQMIAQLQVKAQHHALTERIAAHVDDVVSLRSWPAVSCDGIISAFAGLNTVSDLGTFAAN